jgi:peptidoglycan/LPS O-acetylase OafA/YrhL
VIGLETARSGRRKASRKQAPRSSNRASFHPVPSEFERNSARNAYLPGLDGLRALAVIAVLIYHARPGWLPGGFLGVEVFFVISGFIITRALLNEVRATGRINVLSFWMRRARRLLPAVVLLLAGTLTYALVFEPDQVTELRADALAAMVYVTNWHLMTGGQSYFNSFQQPSMLRHLWSLAVEEQFYVVWPMLLAAGLPILKQKGMLALILIGIAASTAGMTLLYVPAGDTSRVYYGTDTRAAALLAGAALAFVAGGWRMADARWAPKVMALIGLAATALVLGAMVWLDERQALLYRGGFLAVSLASTVVILAATQPNLFSKALSLSPLRWIGERSYGIYLWHWPIYLLVWPNEATLGQLAAQITATVFIAALSYALVEKPIREGALSRLWESARRWSTLSLRYRGGLVFGASSAAAIVIGLFAASLAAKAPELPAYFEMQSIRLHGSVVADDASSVLANSPTMSRVQSTLSALTRKPGACPLDYEAPPMDAGSVSSAPYGPECPSPVSILRAPLESKVAGHAATAVPEVPVVVETPVATPEPAPPPAAPSAPAGQAVSPPTPLASAPRVTAIGDSVMLGAAYSLAAAVPGIDIDAVVGRQAAATVALVRERLNSNMLGEVVLIHAGNNGPIYASHIDEIMQLAGPSRRVIFLTVTVPRAWQEPNNAVLASTLAKYANATLLDWHGASEANPALVYTDGIHLTSSGAAQYATMVVGAVGR